MKTKEQTSYIFIDIANRARAAAIQHQLDNDEKGNDSESVPVLQIIKLIFIFTVALRIITVLENLYI